MVKCRKRAWVPRELPPPCDERKERSPIKAEHHPALGNLQGRLQTLAFQGPAVQKIQGPHAIRFWSKINIPCSVGPFLLTHLGTFGSFCPIGPICSVILALNVCCVPVTKTKNNKLHKMNFFFFFLSLAQCCQVSLALLMIALPWPQLPWVLIYPPPSVNSLTAITKCLTKSGS